MMMVKDFAKHSIKICYISVHKSINEYLQYQFMIQIGRDTRYICNSLLIFVNLSSDPTICPESILIEVRFILGLLERASMDILFQLPRRSQSQIERPPNYECAGDRNPIILVWKNIWSDVSATVNLRISQYYSACCCHLHRRAISIVMSLQTLQKKPVRWFDLLRCKLIPVRGKVSEMIQTRRVARLLLPELWEKDECE